MNDPGHDVETWLRAVAIICLTTIIVAAIAGITVVAVVTDRDLRSAEGLIFGAVVILAALAGFSIRSIRRRHRWRLERTDTDEQPPAG